GTSGRSMRDFAAALQGAGVTRVIDVRLRNTGQLSGFAKKEDLRFLLELLKIDYTHAPQLAPAEAILDRFRQNRDWEAYAEAFRTLMGARDMPSILEEAMSGADRPCLLCACARHEQCHRALLAQALEGRGWQVEHLR